MVKFGGLIAGPSELLLANSFNITTNVFKMHYALLSIVALNFFSDHIIGIHRANLSLSVRGMDQTLRIATITISMKGSFIWCMLLVKRVRLSKYQHFFNLICVHFLTHLFNELQSGPHLVDGAFQMHLVLWRARNLTVNALQKTVHCLSRSTISMA